MKIKTSKSVWKKVILGVCSAVLMFGVACLMKPNGSVAEASGEVGLTEEGFCYVGYEKAEAEAIYGKQDNIPVATDKYANWLFAGWYTDKTCTIPVQTVAELPETGAYAKFVNPDVLSMKLQIKSDAGEESTTATNMRIVSSVDSLNYRKVGFLIRYNGNTPMNVYTSRVYERIVASSTSGVAYNYSPKVVGTESEYFVTATLVNIAKGNYGKNFHITPYWVTMDGVTVTGVSKQATVDDGLTTTTINATVLADLVKGNEYSVTYGTAGTATATVLESDGVYSNIRITLPEAKTSLQSVTKFTIENGENDVVSYYRNLETKYVGEGSEDTSWYEAYDAATTEKYVIATNADLYGMEYLANYNGGKELVTFSGKKVYMIADITVNEGSASLESGWAQKEGTTQYNWYAIRGFAGTFDGQGHAISGLYGTMNSSTTSGHYAVGFGLFTETVDATICNLTLKNSYYNVTNTNGAGAIVGKGYGTLKNIHVDTVIDDKSTSGAGRMGGIVGLVTGIVTVDNCWSESDIRTKGPYSGGIVGNANGKTVTVKHCLNSGSYTYTGTGNAYAGGIVGRGDASGTVLTIQDCLNLGIIKGETTEQRLGSILGTAAATGVTITNAYSVENYQIDGTTLLPNVGNDARTEKTGTASLPYQDLYDMNAFSNTELTFEGYVSEGYWAIRDNNTPMLVSFLNDTDETIGVTGRSKTDFVIVDGVGYISVLSQLEDFRDKINDGLKLKEDEIALMTDDIEINADADAAAWADGSAELPEAWVAIKGFAGTFDGQGYTISGMYTNKHNSGTGLFTNADGVTIRNLCIEESYINQASGTAGTGFVIGLGNGTLENIKVSGIINSTKNSVGGLVGCVNGDVTITNCWTDCDITSSAAYTGGMIGNYSGSNLKITLSHSLNSGDITSSANYLGGMIGRVASGTAANWNNYLKIEDCLNVGKVIDNKGGGYAGGLLGYASGTYNEEYTTVIINSYSAVQYDANSNALGVEKIIGTDKGAINTNSNYIALEVISGVGSYYYTNLDLYSSSNQDAYWVAREGATPMLATYYDGEKLNISDQSSETFALTNNKGYIANAAQFLSFATQMNAGEITTDSDTVIMLANDIDMDGASWAPVLNYGGTFDGNGHTIKGLVMSTTATKGCGLFTMTEGIIVRNMCIEDTVINAYSSDGTGAIIGKGNGTIENVSVKVTMNSNNKNAVAGIIGNANGTTTVRNCWNQTDISSSGAYTGGILGNASSGLEITIEHCLNSGNISYTGTGGGQYGGLVGRANGGTATSGALTIKDCLNVGIVKAENSTKPYIGGLLGYAPKCEVSVNQGTTIIDSYSAKIYVEDVLQGTESLVGAYGTATYTVTAGSAALNYNELVGVAGFNNTSLAFWNADDQTGYWVAAEGMTPMLASFVADDMKVIDTSAFSQTEFRLTNNTGTISNAEQLSSFRDKMNAGKLTVDANTVIELTNDITLNEGWTASATAPETKWTPIQGYAGVFDGKGYTISGLYATSVSGIKGIGLFTETDGVTIQNLNITNSYFKVDTSNGSGPVVGLGSGTVKNVYTEAIMVDNSASTKGRIGGIVGKADGDMVIENCWSNSQIESKWVYVGGIMGYSNAQNVDILHCLNTGSLTYTGSADSYFGGIVGTSCSSSATSYAGTLQIMDCLNVGTVSGIEAEQVMGGVIGCAGGANESEEATVVITNSYAAICYDESDTFIGMIIPVGDDRGASLTDCKSIDYDNLIGELGYNYMNLDFVTDSNSDGYWTVREGNAPILTYFFKQGDTVLNTFTVSKTSITDVLTAYGTEIPQYYTSSANVSTHSVGKGGYEICIQESSQLEFDAYSNLLKTQGFILVSESTIADNLFYTYAGKDIHLYLSWNPGRSVSRVIMTPEEVLPSLRTPKVTTSDTKVPTVTQMQFDGLGMLYVIQLKDGSYIIVDGGTNTYDTDKERLYEYLCDNTTKVVPTISCWMYTHPDPDHIGLATAFLEEYADKVDVKSFAYNFAREDFTSSQDDAAIYTNIELLESNMIAYYPNALKYTIHAGQTLRFVGVEVEILQTEEEFYPNTTTLWNDTSAAWRMKFDDGQTALFLGDSMQILCQQLEDTYGSYLKSDMLQMAHHGLLGGDLELYRYINPDVCFWSTTEEKYNSSEYRGYNYNAYLLNAAIKERKFYHNGHMGVVRLNDDGTITPNTSYVK